MRLESMDVKSSSHLIITEQGYQTVNSVWIPGWYCGHQESWINNYVFKTIWTDNIL